eukprot:1177520-Prorocentrum_minimum.AAC.5
MVPQGTRLPAGNRLVKPLAAELWVEMSLNLWTRCDRQPGQSTETHRGRGRVYATPLTRWWPQRFLPTNSTRPAPAAGIEAASCPARPARLATPRPRGVLAQQETKRVARATPPRSP